MVLRISAAAAGDIQRAVDHIRTVVRTQAVHLLADTVEPVVDTVIVAGIADVPKVDFVPLLERELERSTEEVQEWQWDTLVECSRYIVLRFPCFS